MKTTSKQIKRPVADKNAERLKRLKALSERLHGKLKNFMTQDDLRKMRANKDWEAIQQSHRG
jgi:hypothetical protein